MRKKSSPIKPKAGKLKIDPIELRCSIRIENTRNNRDPFATFFGGSYQLKEEIIRSKSVLITVANLPSAPANFKGAVGNMSIKSEVDNNTISANRFIEF